MISQVIAKINQQNTSRWSCINSIVYSAIAPQDLTKPTWSQSPWQVTFFSFFFENGDNFTAQIWFRDITSELGELFVRYCFQIRSFRWWCLYCHVQYSFGCCSCHFVREVALCLWFDCNSIGFVYCVYLNQTVQWKIFLNFKCVFFCFLFSRCDAHIEVEKTTIQIQLISSLRRQIRMQNLHKTLFVLARC